MYIILLWRVTNESALIRVFVGNSDMSIILTGRNGVINLSYITTPPSCITSPSISLSSLEYLSCDHFSDAMVACTETTSMLSFSFFGSCNKNLIRQSMFKEGPTWQLRVSGTSCRSRRLLPVALPSRTKVCEVL